MPKSIVSISTLPDQGQRAVKKIVKISTDRKALRNIKSSFLKTQPAQIYNQLSHGSLFSTSNKVGYGLSTSKMSNMSPSGYNLYTSKPARKSNLNDPSSKIIKINRIKNKKSQEKSRYLLKKPSQFQHNNLKIEIDQRKLNIDISNQSLNQAVSSCTLNRHISSLVSTPRKDLAKGSTNAGPQNANVHYYYQMKNNQTQKTNVRNAHSSVTRYVKNSSKTPLFLNKEGFVQSQTRYPNKKIQNRKKSRCIQQKKSLKTIIHADVSNYFNQTTPLQNLSEKSNLISFNKNSVTTRSNRDNLRVMPRNNKKFSLNVVKDSKKKLRRIPNSNNILKNSNLKVRRIGRNLVKNPNLLGTSFNLRKTRMDVPLKVGPRNQVEKKETVYKNKYGGSILRHKFKPRVVVHSKKI